MVSSQFLKMRNSITKESKSMLKNLRNGTLNEWKMALTEANAC